MNIEYNKFLKTIFRGIKVKNNSHLLTEHKKNSESVLRLVVGMALMMSLSQTAIAADVIKRIIVDSSIERNSNPAFTESDKEPVWLYTIIPQFNLDVSDGLNLWYLETALVLQQPSNNEVFFDRQDPRLALGWDRTYESGSYGAKIGYEQSAGRKLQLLSVGGINNVDTKQRAKYFNGRWQHDFNARWSLINLANYTRTEFSGVSGAVQPIGVAPPFINFDVSEVRSRLAYDYTEKLITYTELGFVKYMPETFRDDTDLYRVHFGADYMVKPGLEVGGHAGLYTTSGQQSDSGWEAGISAEYVVDRMSYSASLSRSLGSGGLLGFQQIDALQAAWQFNVSELNLLGVDALISDSEEDDSVGLPNIKSQQLNAFYERQLSSQWKMRFLASYQAFDVNDSISRGTLVGVRLTYDSLDF